MVSWVSPRKNVEVKGYVLSQIHNAVFHSTYCSISLINPPSDGNLQPNFSPT